MEGKDSTLEGFFFSAEAAKNNLNRCISSNLLASSHIFAQISLRLSLCLVPALSFFHSVRYQQSSLIVKTACIIPAEPFWGIRK